MADQRRSGRALSCPIEIEFFADGTAEANYLSEGPAACSFARVPAERVAGDPPVVRLAGQLSACLWKREGPRLRLACEDHREPPPSFELSIVLERHRVEPREGLDAVVGRWQSPAFWGPPVTFEVRPDGQFTLAGSSGRLAVRSDGRLDMSRDSRVTHCLYRALADRLTLRCGHAGDPAPTSFASEAPMVEVVVFGRE